MRSFTTQAANDLPEGMTMEQYTRAYAAYGRWCDLSREFIPWLDFLDYVPAVDEIIQQNEDGSMVVETTVKLRYLRTSNDETPVPDLQEGH